MRNNEGGNEKQEIYLVWPYVGIIIGKKIESYFSDRLTLFKHSG